MTDEQIAVLDQSKEEAAIQAQLDADDALDDQRRIYALQYGMMLLPAITEGYVKTPEIIKVAREAYLFLIKEDPMVDLPLYENQTNVVNLEEYKSRINQP